MNSVDQDNEIETINLDKLNIQDNKLFLDPKYCSRNIEMSKVEPPIIFIENYIDSIIDSYIEDEIVTNISVKKLKLNNSFKLICIDNDTIFNELNEFSSYIESNIVKKGDFFIYKLKKEKETVEFCMRNISDIQKTIYKYHIIKYN